MELSTRELLFKEHGVLGRLFGLPPWKVFVLLGGAAVLLLLLPAFLINVHSIPYVHPEFKTQINLGVFPSANWSFVYPVLVPLIFALAAYVSGRTRSSIERLCSGKSCVFFDERGHPAKAYAEDMQAKVSASSVALAWATVWFTVVIMIADTWDLWFVMYESFRTPGHAVVNPPPSLLPDWDTAYRLKSDLYPEPPSIRANLVFNIIAYAFQGGAAFLAFFWVGKMFTVLKAFAATMSGGQGYHFRPLTSDRHLGLRWMGGIFDGFLLIVVIFQAFAFLHRLQLAGRDTPGGFWGYVGHLLRGMKDPALIVSNNRFDTMDPGMLVILFGMAIPMIVVVYLPLFKIRRYVAERRDEAYNEFVWKRQEAIDRGDSVAAADYLKKMDVMRHANIWPNGDEKARLFLESMALLALGALAPALFAYLLGVGIVYELIKRIRTPTPPPAPQPI